MESNNTTMTPRTGNVDEMLKALTDSVEVRVQSQQKDEADLTEGEKFDKLKQALEESPYAFLRRFGKYIQSEDQLATFDCFKDDNIVVHLQHLRKTLARSRVRCRNRRYVALQKLVESSDYFSEEEMQRRNPILFEQLIGKFQTKEEKEAFAQRSYTSSVAGSNTPLTDLLMAHMDRNEKGESCRRLDQEKQKADEDEADAEYLDDYEDSVMDDDSGVSMRENRGNGGNNADDDQEESEEIEDEEKELFKEEFFTTMYRNFLQGKDVDVDYQNIDNNEDYDVDENLDQDEEDKYFAEEDPCEEMLSDSNSVSSSEFKPPVRCSEIESKIFNLSVEDSTATTSKEENMSMTDEEEDALDAYMKTVEKELKNC